MALLCPGEESRLPPGVILSETDLKNAACVIIFRNIWGTILDTLDCLLASPRMPAMGMQRLKLLGTVSLLALALNTTAVHAGNYIATNETEFLNAIALANTDGDASSTITLTGNVALTSPSLLPAITKTLTIDTGSFTLSDTGDTVFDTADGQTLTISGATTSGGLFKEGRGTTILSGVDGDQGSTVTVTSGLLQIDGGSQIAAGLNTSWAPVRVSGGTLLLDGAGTTFTVNPGGASSYVGGTAGAQMIIAGGAQFVTPGGFGLATTATESGSLSVTGAGSLFDGASVSTLAGQVEIAISAGGAIRSSSVGIGGLSSGLYNNGTGTVVVSDGARWSNTGAFRLFNGSMDILAGGSVASSTVHIAAAVNSGNMTADLIVDGIGSQLTTTGTAANAFQIGGGNTSGARSGSLTISNGGAVSVAGGTGTLNVAQVANANGTINIGGAEGEAATGAGTLSAGNIAFGAGTGILNLNHTDANYGFDTALTGNGTINQIGSGKTVLTDDQSAFSGQSNINAGTLAVNGVLGGTMNVAGGRLQGIGTVGSTIHEAGSVIAPGNSIGTLTIAGDYSGNGGLVEIEALLGDDSSSTDLLRITGDTSGTGSVKVINIGGTGAPTAEGIRIIEVGGASNGVFSLNGDYLFEGEQAVIGGAYAYRLYQNGVSTPGDGDWYLRSALVPVVPPVEPPVTPPAPATPLYQPGVPSYEAYPQALLGLNGLNTLQERVGNRFWAGAGNKIIAQGADAVQPYAAPEEAGVNVDGNGVWGRIEGAHNKIKPRFSTSDTDYNQNVFKLQAGIDGLLNETENGTLIGGVFVQYVHGKTKINSVYGDGEISTDGYGFGGTLTWHGNEGFYIDGQAQVTWYRSDLASDSANMGLADGNKGLGYAFSAEAGKRIAIDPEWSVTPQAQLVYSRIDFDNFSDTFGAPVSLDKGDSLQGRLGLTLDHETSWQNANGMTDRTHVYGIANLYYEFLKGTRVDVAGIRFASEKERLWGGIGLGGSYNWNDDKYSIYGEGIVNTSLKNFGDSHSLKGNVGFRMKW